MIDVSTKAARAKFYGSDAWKALRQSRIELDNFECQWCKLEGGVTIKGQKDEEDREVILEVDHIKELKDHPEHALDIDNLRTLCKDCHNKRHKRFNYRPSKKKKKWDDEWW